jgi:hypothetical protein
MELESASATLAVPAPPAHLDHPETWDNPVNLDSLVFLELRVCLEPPLQSPWMPLECAVTAQLDPADHPDHKELLVPLELEDHLALLASVETMDAPDPLDHLDHKDILETQEDLVDLEVLATQELAEAKACLDQKDQAAEWDKRDLAETMVPLVSLDILEDKDHPAHRDPPAHLECLATLDLLDQCPTPDSMPTTALVLVAVHKLHFCFYNRQIFHE